MSGGGEDLTLQVAAVAAAQAAHEALSARGATCATAESLTGGLIGAHLTAVPGSSKTYRGGVVTYATQTKADLLRVPEDLLAAHGAVHPEVAEAMASGARRLLGADFAVAVTGVAGPEPQDGQPVGTVFAAVAGPFGNSTTRALRFTGDRGGIRYATVEGALALLESAVRGNAVGGTRS